MFHAKQGQHAEDTRQTEHADSSDVTEKHRTSTIAHSWPKTSPKKRSYVDIKGLSIDPLHRKHRDEKVVGLAEGIRRATEPSTESLDGSLKHRIRQHTKSPHRDYLTRTQRKGSLDDDEQYARSRSEKRPIVLFVVGYYTACKIFFYYLISLSSLLTCGLTVGLTIYWYNIFLSDPDNKTATGMDWVLLGFAVITPLSLSVGIAFRRRERALVEIAKFRSFSFQLFLSHCLWDWGEAPKGKAGCNIDWEQHADAVLSELVAVGDELCRFLTLPTTSRSRHRVTRTGRHEAARTAEVAYRLYDSLYTKRMINLAILGENIKNAGLPSGEVSRMRQYERFMGEAFENLRMVKTYRTPQTLRSFARLFTTLLPPFFAPTYAQLAKNVDSLPVGITFAVVTSLCLNALLEGVEILEDPFVAFVTLDGIDVREEFQVLHWQQLMNARSYIFPQAMPYGDPRQTASLYAGDLADVELGTLEENVSQTGLGNDSESTRESARRETSKKSPVRPAHRKIFSLGDANLLANVKGGFDPAAENMIRESAYQLYGRDSSDLDSSFHSAVTERAKSPNKEGNAKTIVGEKK